MVERLALRIAEAIKKAEPEKTASVAVMKYALESILHTSITIGIIAIIGAITGKLGITMIGLGAFIFLRYFSGGLHLNKAIHCSIVSTILVSIAPHIPLSEMGIYVVASISVIIILIFAPANIDEHARIPLKYHPFLKLISAAIVSVNFLFINSTLAMVFLIQAITTINIKRR